MTPKKTTILAVIPQPNEFQLFLPLLSSIKTPKRKQIHPSRKRRRAEKIAPSCPL
jgi:hypothetical protein